MQVVVDSRKFKKLIYEVSALQRYEVVEDQRDVGVRDGNNEAVVRILEKLTSFWNELTKE